jgi:hypothetical protein
MMVVDLVVAVAVVVIDLVVVVIVVDLVVYPLLLWHSFVLASVAVCSPIVGFDH